MRICAKSLYPAPLLDIEITAKQVLEEIQAVLILVKIIDSAQEKYKAIPNEQYSPAIIRNIKEGMISIKCELIIFPKAENAKEFAFGLSGMF